MSLTNSYQFAASVSANMKNGPVYLRVKEGKYANSVGKVMRLEQHNYSRHTFFLSFGTRTIGICSSKLEETDQTVVVYEYNPEYCRTYYDCNEREIELGQTIICACPSRAAGIILGTVQKITNHGVSVVPCMAEGNWSAEMKPVLIREPKGSMVIDRDTINMILVQKLAAKIV